MEEADKRVSFGFLYPPGTGLLPSGWFHGQPFGFVTFTMKIITRARRLPFTGIVRRALLGASMVGAIASACRAASLSSGQVVVGDARFTVVSPQCLRLEYRGGGAFIDDPSYFAAHRESRWNGATVTTEGGATTIDTGAVRLTYTPDGKTFHAGNLRAVVWRQDSTAMAAWQPGDANRGNLGGTIRTLDGWDGAGRLADGLLSRDGWYLLDDSRSPLLTRDGWVRGRPANAGVDWYLFGYGDDFKSALQSLAAISGPEPLPRRVMMGAWYSRYWPYTSAEYRAIVDEYAARGFPLDVLVMDMDWHLDGWTGYTWNEKLLPDHQALLDWLHAKGLAVTLNDHPADGVQPHESAYVPFMRAMGKDPGYGKPLPFDAGDRKYLDTFYRYTHRPFEDQGVDFWWLDWQQYPNTRSIPGLTNLAWLNAYNYRETARDGRRGASFSRWGGWGSQRYPIQFSGDASTSFRMLAFEVPFTATAGNVGCFYWSHDIGGHNRGRNEESYARWCQFGAFSAALRSHSTRDASMDRRPWTYAKWAEDSMRVSFQLRSRFFPYLYGAAARSSADAVPFIRPMYIDHAGVEAAYHQPQQYQFGDNLIVAPVAEAGTGPRRVGRQTVWFPPGTTWYDDFTGQRFDGKAGDGTQALVAAPIDRFPLYVQAGVPVPMRPFTQRMATDPLSELVVRCYPGPDGRTAASGLYEDDGTTVAYQRGVAAHTPLSYARTGNVVSVTVGPTVGKFDKQVEQRSITVELPGLASATTATIDGQAVPVDFDAATGTARVHVPTRSIRRGCTVTTVAVDADPAAVRNRAIAECAGIDPVNGSLAEVLAAAMRHAGDDRERAGIGAAAGVGLFGRNETVYGYPATTTDEPFCPPDAAATIRVKATAVAGDDLSAEQAARFEISVAGQTFTARGAPICGSATAGNMGARRSIAANMIRRIAPDFGGEKALIRQFSPKWGSG